MNKSLFCEYEYGYEYGHWHDAEYFLFRLNYSSEVRNSTRNSSSAPVKRDTSVDWLNAALYPEHTGRKQVDDLKTIWSLDWGRCDFSWLDDKNGRGVNPLLLIGTKREPIFFPDRLITQTCFGLVCPDGLDLDMVMEALGRDYADNHSGDRKPWTMAEWGEYIRRGSVPRDRLPRPPMTPQHYVFNMLSLEITGTKLADRFDKPFLQRQLDPLIRFKGQLNADRGSTAGLYVMSSKAGSFTPWHVDATGEVHWLTVVTGIKWVFTLPPTKSNIDVWRKAEHGSIRVDFLGLPDLCTNSPVTKQVVTSGHSILFPSGGTYLLNRARENKMLDSSR